MTNSFFGESEFLMFSHCVSLPSPFACKLQIMCFGKKYTFNSKTHFPTSNKMYLWYLVLHASDDFSGQLINSSSTNIFPWFLTFSWFYSPLCRFPQKSLLLIHVVSCLVRQHLWKRVCLVLRWWLALYNLRHKSSRKWG